jgi:transcriptional regulator with XRE-family HTH domain
MAKSLHTPEYEHFRALLVEARESAGLTQLEVASRLDRPQSFVAKYEGGERRLDVIEFLEVCEALGVDSNRLIAQLRKRVGK